MKLALQEGPIGALVIAVIALGGIIGCSLTGHPIPQELTAVAAAGVGGALGVTNPSGTAAASATSVGPIDQAGGV